MMSGPGSSLRIGRASDMAVSNVAVRTGDRAAFLGIVERREQLLKRVGRGIGASPADRAANLAKLVASYGACAAAEGLDPEKAIVNLELAAALAIEAIAQLKEGKDG